MENLKIGILFVHGIVGNNRIFQFLKSHIPEDCEQLSLTLAGHGSDALAFSKASMNQWRQQVEHGIDALSSRCDRIIAVGHSMGCLFALEQAARGSVDGLLLLSPPLRIRLKLRALTNVVKVGVGIGRNDEKVASALDAYGISIDYNPLHYIGWPMRYVELFRESRKIRDMVKSTRLDCMMAVVISGDDEMVSPDSRLCFSRQPACRVTCLPDAGHYYYSQSDKAVITGIFTDVVDCVKRCQARGQFISGYVSD